MHGVLSVTPRRPSRRYQCRALVVSLGLCAALGACAGQTNGSDGRVTKRDLKPINLCLHVTDLYVNEIYPPVAAKDRAMLRREMGSTLDECVADMDSMVTTKSPEARGMAMCIAGAQDIVQLADCVGGGIEAPPEIVCSRLLRLGDESIQKKIVTLPAAERASVQAKLDENRGEMENARAECIEDASIEERDHPARYATKARCIMQATTFEAAVVGCSPKLADDDAGAAAGANAPSAE